MRCMAQRPHLSVFEGERWRGGVAHTQDREGEGGGAFARRKRVIGRADRSTRCARLALVTFLQQSQYEHADVCETQQGYLRKRPGICLTTSSCDDTQE